MRYLLLALLVYLFYRLLKGKIVPKEPEELVKDPSCGTYIPKKTALRAKVDGRTLYFCSRKCMQKYKERG